MEKSMPRLESERELLATDRRLRNDGGVDHGDPDAHFRAVRDAGSAALKEVRRTVNQNLGGVVRTLIDKVGR
jgi:hypothetical protein